MYFKTHMYQGQNLFYQPSALLFQAFSRSLEADLWKS